MDRSVELPHETPRKLTAFERGLAVASFAAIVGVWVLAAWLTPDPRGIGTHEQLGLAPCRMVTFFGIPCAFCGMTTAFTHLAHGDIVRAVLTQPAAVVFAALTIPAAFVAVFTVVQGGVPAFIAGATTSRRAIAGTILIVLAAWFYKILSYI